MWPFKREKRDAPEDPSWTALGSIAGQFGYAAYASPFAENLATIYACVQSIASAIAALPVTVYRVNNGVKTEDFDNPLQRLIRAGPTSNMSWPELIEFFLASTLLRGNGVIETIYDGRGAVTELRPHSWANVLPVILPSGRVGLDISDPLGLYGIPGNMHRVFGDEALWLRDRTDNGIIGRSRLSRAAGAVTGALQVQDFHNHVFRNGANPSGVFSTDGKIDPDGRKRLAESLREKFTGSSNAAKFMILDGGWKWQAIAINPEDAELLASRKFSTEEMARIYGVPPPLVGIWDHSSFTNAETAGRWFAQFTLTPWLVKIEAEFSRVIFGPSSPSCIMFDLNGLTRGDPNQRWSTYDIAVKDRILTPNEIRGLEGFSPIEGGDDFPLVGADLTRPPPTAPLPPQNVI